MSDLGNMEPQGVLVEGWNNRVGDYAIAGAWSPNGERLIVGDAAGGLYAFEAETGNIAWLHKILHGEGLLALAVNPKQSIVATSGQGGEVIFSNTDNGELTRKIKLGKNWIEHLAWSPNGRLLAVSNSRTVHVYAADGSEVWRSEQHPSTVSAISWASNMELATACYGRVTFFDIVDGEESQLLEWKGSLVSMALSPDGDIVACGSQDNSVHFWRRSTGEDSMMSGYRSKPTALDFDSTGTLLATGGASAASVWSFRDGGPEGTRPGILDIHVQPITTLAFAKRGLRLASGARDGGVIIWSLDTYGDGDMIGAAITSAIVSQLYWKPNGKALAALDAQGEVFVWTVY